MRIPKDIQFAGNVQEVDIERYGDTIVIWPVYTQSLANIMDACSASPVGIMIEGRDQHIEN